MFLAHVHNIRASPITFAHINSQLAHLPFTSSAVAQRLLRQKNPSRIRAWKEGEGGGLPNLIYRRHLDKLQSVISFDAAQRTRRLPCAERPLQEADSGRDARIGYHYVTWARLLLPCAARASALRQSGREKARIINVRAVPLMDRGPPSEHGGE